MVHSGVSLATSDVDGLIVYVHLMILRRWNALPVLPQDVGIFFCGDVQCRDDVGDVLWYSDLD